MLISHGQQQHYLQTCQLEEFGARFTSYSRRLANTVSQLLKHIMEIENLRRHLQTPLSMAT